MLTTGAAAVPTPGGLAGLPDPHRNHGDGPRVMTRPSMMTAKHGVGGFHLAAYRMDFV